MARASGGADNMCPQSGGAQTEIQKKTFTAKRHHLLAINTVKTANFAIFTSFNGVHTKKTHVHSFEPLISGMSTTSDSTPPSVSYF